MILEIVAQSVDDALTAETAGADRLELVSALSLGGLTPSLGTLEEIVSRCKLPVVAMLRPRSGGFGYSEGELSAMERDGERFLAAGAQGLVFGVLNADGLNEKALTRIVRLGGDAVFHRAFDALPDPFDAMERLIDLGFRRILTSGGRGGSLDGCRRLGKLIQQAAGRIEILPGGGVRPENVAEIVRATGANQVHLAGQHWVEDPSTVGLGMVFNGPQHPEDRYGKVDGSTVAAVREAITKM